MGQSWHVDGGDRSADIEVDHHGLARIAPRSQKVAVIRVEEEVVERLIESDAAGTELAGLRNPLDHAGLVAVDEPAIDRLGIVAIGDLPKFRHVLQSDDEAAARAGVVDRADARGCLARTVGGRNHFQRLQVGGIQNDQAVRQVIGRGDVAAIAGQRDVAQIDAGAHFRNNRQVVEVVLGDPAVPRSEEHVAAVRRELRAAVQGEAAGKPVDRLEPVAVEDGDVMVAALHHDEQVQRVRGENGFVRQCGHVTGIEDARCLDVRPWSSPAGTVAACRPARPGP